MNNETRIEIGRALVDLYQNMVGDACKDRKDDMIDAIADILHAAIADQLCEVPDLPHVARAAADHAVEELQRLAIDEMTKEEAWDRLATLEYRETAYAEAGQAEQVRRIQQAMVPIKRRINRVEGTVLYDEAEVTACSSS